MDPVRNPYAPGAGQRPPELTGRDRETVDDDEHLAAYNAYLARINKPQDG